MATVPVTPAKPTVVSLPHELDIANASSVRQELDAALAPGVSVVIADMTATTFCDSMGTRALLLASAHATAAGRELRLVIPSANVLRVIRLLGIEPVLLIYSSLEQALKP